MDGYKVANEVATTDELLYADEDKLYFRLDIEEEQDKYGVVTYDYAVVCPGE